MKAIKLLHKNLSAALPEIHAVRLQALMAGQAPRQKLKVSFKSIHQA